MGKKILLIFFIFIINIFNSACANEVLKINSINFDNSDNIIFLTSNSNVQYINVKPIKLTNPNRLCFDIENAIWTNPNNSWTLKNSDIDKIRLSQFSTEPNTVRLVLNYNKNFSPSKLKLFRINNNLIFIYDKQAFNKDFLNTIYADKAKKNNYYEYTVISEDEKTTNVSDKAQTTQNEQLIAIQNAFNNKNELVKHQLEYTKINKELSQKLKSRYHVNRIDIKRGNALIRGIGTISIEKPFVVKEPTRLVFDLPNTYVSQEIRNKEYILSETETIKIGQFEPTKARIVVTSNDVEKFRPIYSYDGQSIFLAHDDRLLGLKLYDQKSSIYSYSAKKINDTTDELHFTFTEPVIQSIAKFENRVEINLYNITGFDHVAYKTNLNSEVLSKLRTEAVQQGGIKIIIPIKKLTELNYKQSFDNKELKLIINTPKELEIRQDRQFSIIKKNPNVKTIIIDAGHGGSDVGATREGIYEKDLTLDMSKRLYNILKKKGIDVQMVRKNDEYVSLQERVEFSEKHQGDLFISIHVNSSVTPDGHGLETHYFTEQSYELAQTVHKEFTNAINAKDRGLFKSKFYVINHTTCPSILVETGFISNPEERAELLTDERKQKTAEAIAKGILKYLGK